MTNYTKTTWPKDRWPNFSFDEIKCRHTGLCVVDEHSMDLLQTLRSALGFGLKISSAYRSDEHPIEAQKIVNGAARGGAHTYGKAFDVQVEGEKAYRLVGKAIEIGFTGIGIKQNGEGRFIHLDTISKESDPDFGGPRPVIWSY